jgi:hypothetical protein
MISSLAVALFSLVLVAAIFLQGDEVKSLESGSAIERNVVSSSRQISPKANWIAMEELSNEDSLEDLETAYYYQMIEEKSRDAIDCQVEVATPSQSKSCKSFNQINNCQSCAC